MTGNSPATFRTDINGMAGVISVFKGTANRFTPPFRVMIIGKVYKNASSETAAADHRFLIQDISQSRPTSSRFDAMMTAKVATNDS